MKWLAMSRVFRLGSILKWGIPALAIGASAAFYGGVQWCQGQQARQVVAQATEQREARVAERERQHAEALGYETRRAERVDQAQSRQRALRGYVRDHPELLGCGVDDDGLHIIRGWYPARPGDP